MAFDADYVSNPLEHYEPLIRQILRGAENAAEERLAEEPEGLVQAPGHVLRGGPPRGDAQVGQEVRDLGALVEARAADDAVVQPHRDESVLELAHLEGRADEDRHVVELVTRGVKDTTIRLSLRLMAALSEP